MSVLQLTTHMEGPKAPKENNGGEGEINVKL